MAKYDRELLVPYLQNLCALHLTERKIENARAALQYQSDIAFSRRVPKKPEPGDYEIESMANGMFRLISTITFGILLVILFISCVFLSGFLSEIGGLFWPIFIVSGIGFGITWYNAIQIKRQNALVDKAYDVCWENYVKKVDIAEKEAEQEQDVISSKLWVLKVELEKVCSLKEKLYSANVVPRNYRNIYAAYYLYDYFANSREDDLAMALNTFVLEQIKEKLDIVIANQTEIILNQCTMMANQRKMMEQQQDYADRITAKLNDISSSIEERNQYLQMIECNTEATAYFAAATYLK